MIVFALPWQAAISRRLVLLFLAAPPLLLCSSSRAQTAASAAETQTVQAQEQQDQALAARVAAAEAAAAREAYDDDPAADPARPTVTNPAHIPPPGYLQFEQGFLQADTTPGGGPDLQLGVTQTIKIALSHHFMGFEQSQPYARSITGGDISHDAGDVALGAQVVLLDEKEGHDTKPTLAVSYIGRVHAGTSPNLDTGDSNRSLLLLASGDLHHFHYDTNVVFSEQQASSANLPGHIAPRRAQFAQSLSLSRALPRKFGASVEVWRASQPFTHGNAIGTLYAGSYTPHRTLVLDMGFSRGLTGTSTHWETFAGFTYLLPHRVLPRRHRDPVTSD